ncbi:hypothetical protein [Spiroplasma floricola]|uniref:Transmembrane protein n=1 Tax=Spiroplasma floricola 23-6 TaxID=1336749 RepID=A0A2K8SE25_9MOLU|nr:hypothetical protein [Spiroplasma floricola]AUB31716.1 hypothetical protein SFLOR_v1c06660 [Spiroplasma floricola 23-6]
MLSKIKLFNPKQTFSLLISYSLIVIYILFLLLYKNNSFLFANKVLINNFFLTCLLAYLFINLLSILLTIKNKEIDWRNFIKLYKKRVDSIFIFKVVLVVIPLVLFITIFFFKNKEIAESNNDQLVTIFILFSMNFILIVSLVIMMIIYKILKKRNPLIDFEPINFFIFDLPLFFIRRIRPIFKKETKKIIKQINKVFEFFNDYFIFLNYVFMKNKILLLIKKKSIIPLA